MNYLRVLMSVSLGLITSFAYSAEIDITIQRMCSPVLEKKCKEDICSDLNLVLDGVYNKCADSVKDVEDLKNSDDLVNLNINSDVGFLIGFSNLISRALSTKNFNDTFAKVKKEYVSLKEQYKVYLQKNSDEFLRSLDFLTEEKNQELKEKLITEDKNSQAKIKDRTARLDIMLESEEGLKLYRQTHAKFIPAILFESNALKFKDKTFSPYECNFLKLNFEKLELDDIQKSLAFKCE